ncbi:MAG: urease accessory protein UreD [Alphaproteobacteria bacterium]|nr:urease accessory protein UreD [Alphaproteobacteria bacterium]MBU1515235.1 urease accessory protein UreD [Alphaproteobacteria bacterium]MBU2092365.1 urease accessory protein UreD [Alphaproteobacteria bacterium]MBU2152959.1 urease accessory protein UreD [Alphaproteobacteria bacterium]MBU2305790.1 urease accessory protein UreD [Alphaproteobacteria bacterium]
MNSVIQGPASLPELPRLQRARGVGRIVVAADAGRTRLARLYQDGCGKIRLPRDARAEGLEAVLINSSGGLTGGDYMEWMATVGDGARLTLSTQACEKVYRARDGQAQQRVALILGENARLDWVPQETILFDGGALSRRLEADLAEGARLLCVEAVVLGRTAMDETVRQGSIRDHWRIRREGRLVFADDLRLDGAVAEIAAAAPVLAGGKAFASLLLVDDDAARFLKPLRVALGAYGGASAFEGKLFARIVAPDGFALREALLPALEVLRDGEPLPRVWRT